MVATLNASPRSFFEVAVRILRRHDQTPILDTAGRTLTIEVRDASRLLPLVGVHRIQRIPKGETKRHTSTCTLCILDLDRFGDKSRTLVEADLQETFARGSGPGGQHRNKTNSCVVLKHIPTGLEVRIDGRSQWQNRQEARRELARRLSELDETGAICSDNTHRVQQVASADRAAKTFTWNTQRDEVLDHQTGRRWRMSEFQKGKI